MTSSRATFPAASGDRRSARFQPARGRTGPVFWDGPGSAAPGGTPPAQRLRPARDSPPSGDTTRPAWAGGAPGDRRTHACRPAGRAGQV